MKYQLLFILLFLLGFNCHAQSVELYGEGSNETVRLLWLPYQWPSNSEGVFIKRKALGSDEWEQVNSSPIVQEMNEKTDLKNVILDKDIRQEVIDKRTTQLNVGDWKPAPAELFSQVLAKGDKNRWMRFGFRQDYDLALASGFGMIDKPGGKTKKWVYGLFFSKTQKEPTASIEIEMKTPDYQLKISPKLVPNRNISKLVSYWVMDSIAFRKNHLLFGFSLVKEEENSVAKYLDKEPLLPGKLKEGFAVRFTDSKINKNLKTTYKLQVKTIFNTYHLVSEVTFDPSSIPPDKLSISMLQIDDKDHDLSKGLPPVTWEYDQEDEKYISGFLLMEDKGFEDWEIVSDTIHKSARSYIDPRTPINKKLYKLKIAAIKNMNFGLGYSNWQQYYYKYSPKAPAPQVSYEWVEKGGGHFLRIYWSEDNKAANTVGYRLLYSYSGHEDSYSCPSDGRNLKEPEYYYNVQDPYGRYYFFKVAQIDADNNDGAFSPGTKALTHTTQMPYLNVYKGNTEGKKITVIWQKLTPTIEDLAGFDVYVNGKLIKTEGPEATETVYEAPKPGKYTLKIVAKTQFGLTTEGTWKAVVE